jgi:hypothetical protein
MPPDDQPHPEGEPKPDLILLAVPVPPGLAEVFGYRYGARLVSFHWEPSGDDVWFDDGRHSGTGGGWGFLAYLRHRHVAPHLEPYNLGGSDMEADHALVIDRQQDLAGIIPVAAARAFLQNQLPPLPHLTPEQTEQAGRALDEAAAQGWREVRVDPDAVLRIMEERRRALEQMLSYLERWPHV